MDATVTSPYLDLAHAALPRVLALFDRNPISPTAGVGDRYHWAWKGSDFSNGTFQGAVHGLACLVANDMLPLQVSKEKMLNQINQIIRGTATITRSNGSLDEILPLESSYCVTALVAYDVLSALEQLDSILAPLERKEHIETIKPLIEYISGHTEHHGIITNHLAAAVAALAHWQKATGEDMSQPIDLAMEKINGGYSQEGWFREYDGADFGYQTLALDYLVDCDRLLPMLGLGEKLKKVINFLSYAAHPDGSFGGTYGSRNTRFLYPAGIEKLTANHEDAVALAVFARKAHESLTVVGLPALDEPNFVTMFNSVCRAAIGAKAVSAKSSLPFEMAPFQTQFPEAGLIVSNVSTNYSIVNWRKGGSLYSSSGKISGGILASNKAGEFFTSQSASGGKLLVADANEILIESTLQAYRVSYPSPVKMIILRLLCLTVMRIDAINVLIKKLLVKLLIRNSGAGVAVARRRITLSDFTVTDEWVSNRKGLVFGDIQDFHAIHMASQGYWQLGDEK